jgi:hypothetical protein
MRARIRSALLGLCCAACASIRFEPTDEDSGTFESSAVAVTFLGRDFPQSALALARANAADSELPNLLVQEELVFPYFWRLDFLLDVVSVRWATISGTYGPPDEAP